MMKGELVRGRPARLPARQNVKLDRGPVGPARADCRQGRERIHSGAGPQTGRAQSGFPETGEAGDPPHRRRPS